MKKLLLMFALAGTLAFSQVCLAQTTVALSPLALPQFLNNNGQPCSGCKLSTFSAGTTSNLVTYSESTGTTPNSNPIIMDSSGRPSNGSANVEIFLTSASYKFKMTDANNVQLWVVDNISWATPLTTFSGITSTGNSVIRPAVAATGGANQNSPTLCIDGFYFNISSLTDQWCLQTVLGTGTNPTTTFNVTHSGSSGTATFNIPGNETVGGTLGVTGATTLAAAKNIGNVLYASQFTGSSTTCGVAEAIAALPASGGKVILQQGACTITTNISITKPVWLEGQCTLLLNDAAYAAPTGCSELVLGATVTSMITVSLPASNFLSGVWFSNFSLNANSNGEGIKFVGGSGATALRDVGAFNVVIRRGTTANWHVSNNVFIAHFINIGSFRATTDGFLIDATTGSPSQIRIEHSDLDLNGGCAVHMSSAGGGSGGDIEITDSTMADSTLSGWCIDNGVSGVAKSRGNHYESNTVDGLHWFGSSNHTSTDDLFFTNTVNDINLSCAGQGFASVFAAIRSSAFLGATPTNIRMAASCNNVIIDHPSPNSPVIVDAGTFQPAYILNSAYQFALGLFTVLGTPYNTGGTACIALKDTTAAQATPTKSICSAAGSLRLQNNAGTPIVTTEDSGTVTATGFSRSASTVRLIPSPFTTANNTSLQAITSLTWTLPAQALNYSFHCVGSYSQATANVAVAFGIQAVNQNPTNINATGTIWTSTTASTSGTAAIASTTATNIVSATPSATATNFKWELDGTLEITAVGTNTINIMVSTAAGADAVTVNRGAYCQLY